MTIDYSKKELILNQLTPNKIAIYGIMTWTLCGIDIGDRFSTIGYFTFISSIKKWLFTQYGTFGKRSLKPEVLEQIAEKLRKLNEETTEDLE
jgi:hypothetical protein